MNQNPSPENTLVSTPALQNVLAYSLLGALCPLIPVPFVDDIVLTQLRKRMHKALFKLHDLNLSDKGADALLASPSNIFGSIFRWLIGYPLKWIFKKLLVVKAISDLFSALFHEGWLLARALEAGLITPEELTPGKQAESLKALRRALLATENEITTSPVTLILKRIFSLRLSTLTGAAKGLTQTLHSDDKEESTPLAERLRQLGLGDVLNELMGAMGGQQDYFQHLEQRLRHHLQR